MKHSHKSSPQVKSRKKYSAQFKDQVLERVAKDGVPNVSKDLGIPDSMLYSWRARRRLCGDSLERQKLQQGELAQLKRENQRLHEENDFLKKAAAYFAKERR